jgi:hypothetical protein
VLYFYWRLVHKLTFGVIIDLQSVVTADASPSLARLDRIKACLSVNRIHIIGTLINFDTASIGCTVKLVIFGISLFAESDCCFLFCFRLFKVYAFVGSSFADYGDRLIILGIPFDPNKVLAVVESIESGLEHNDFSFDVEEMMIYFLMSVVSEDAGRKEEDHLLSFF